MASKTPTTSSFSLSDTQAIGEASGDRVALDASLSSLSSPPSIQGTVSGSVNTPPTAELIDSEDLTEPQEQETSEETDDSDDTAEGFDLEFSKRFGVEPAEALETVNSLLAFRDEMSIMRAWGVSPGEYDQRMAEVKEFYSTLPEDKQPEFNSMEGAKAIWEHLSKASPAKKTKPTASGVVGSKKTPTTQQRAPFIKKSEILKMDKDTYSNRLPEITRAFREGRVLENE